jgi:beta-galactosidase/beta-glucuronidase
MDKRADLMALAARDRMARWIAAKFRTRFAREWQLAKVEMRLACADGGGDWRSNLLAQQSVLRALATNPRHQGDEA